MRPPLTPDWPESETVAGRAQSNGFAQAGAASVALDMSGAARSDGDHLWEDNWDDDDIEDDFSHALRYVCVSRGSEEHRDIASTLC